MASPRGISSLLVALTVVTVAVAVPFETNGPFCCYHEYSRNGAPKQCTTLSEPGSWCSTSAVRCLTNCNGVFYLKKDGTTTRRNDKQLDRKEKGYCCFHQTGKRCSSKSPQDSWCSHSSARCKESCNGVWYPSNGEPAPQLPQKPIDPPQESTPEPVAPIAPSTSAGPTSDPLPSSTSLPRPSSTSAPQPSSNPEPPLIDPPAPSSDANPPVIRDPPVMLPPPSPSTALFPPGAEPAPPAITTPKPGSSGCAPPAFFCEDFESPLKANLKLDGDATVGPAGSRGGNALVLTPEGGGKGRLIAEGVVPGNSFYGRIYARVEKFPTAPVYSHWVLTEVFADEKGTEQVRPLGGQYIEPTTGTGENRWGIGADQGPSGDWTAHEETAPTTDGTWQCLEWQLEDTGSDNFVRVWLDGVPQPKMTQSRFENGSGKEFKFPNLKNIWFGWWNFQGETTPKKFNVLIDDIVLSTERVGCR